MRSAHVGVLIALALLGCKKERPPAGGGSGSGSAVAAAIDGGAAGGAPGWYRAVIRAEDGVEAIFFLGVPAPGAPGVAVFKAADHEVKTEATFDGTTLKVPIAVHQTAVEAAVGPEGKLAGKFTTAWRAWGESSLPLTATKVDAPATSALATVSSSGPPLDLGEPRTVWKLTMSEGTVAKLSLSQTAPGDFAGVVFVDNGNTLYLAGNGRGDLVTLGGFDGTSAYRLELVLATDRKGARGKLFGGHRLDWREVITAERVPDFPLVANAKAEKADGKIGLPSSPELAALGSVPLVVEIAGSWCSTCRNAAKFLVELYGEYRPRGLNMVTLLYEFSDDPAFDAKQAETFKKSYNVTWPVIPVRGGVEDFAKILPSGLTGVDPAGFPVTLFLAADRSLVAVHAGFPAVDAVEEHRRVAAEFRANVEKLLAAQAGAGSAAPAPAAPAPAPAAPAPTPAPASPAPKN